MAPGLCGAMPDNLFCMVGPIRLRIAMREQLPRQDPLASERSATGEASPAVAQERVRLVERWVMYLGPGTLDLG